MPAESSRGRGVCSNYLRRAGLGVSWTRERPVSSGPLVPSKVAGVLVAAGGASGRQPVANRPPLGDDSQPRLCRGQCPLLRLAPQRCRLQKYMIQHSRRVARDLGMQHCPILSRIKPGCEEPSQEDERANHNQTGVQGGIADNPSPRGPTILDHSFSQAILVLDLLLPCPTCPRSVMATAWNFA